MRWFNGTIPEAIAASKSKNAVFVVFIEGNDEASKSAGTVLESEEVSTNLDTDDFVTIKLQSDSAEFKQFAQIYFFVPVPSIFFIGSNGSPLEIIANNVNSADLLSKLTSVLEKHRQGTPSVSTAPQSQEPPSQIQNASSSAGNVPVSLMESVSGPQVENEPPQRQTGSDPSHKEEVTKSSEDASQAVAGPSTSVENQVDRAKELLEQKRAQRQKEEEEKERRQEIERRKLGQDIQKMRRMQQDQEMKQLLEERKKEKAAEAAARERVKQQIAQDRADRLARGRTEPVTEQRPREQQSPSEPRSVQSDVARIQFRFPDGTSHAHEFPATVTISEVRQYISSLPELPSRSFQMSTAFPRRLFTEEDNQRSLRDLGLTPSVVILILPITSAISRTSSDSVAVFRTVFWTILSPFFAVYNYVRNMLFGGGRTGHTSPNVNARNNENSQDTSRGQSPSSSASTNNSGVRQRSVARETHTISRQGNIHRLTDRRDSNDDENNTWNGNSTQQM